MDNLEALVTFLGTQKERLSEIEAQKFKKIIKSDGSCTWKNLKDGLGVYIIFYENEPFYIGYSTRFSGRMKELVSAIKRNGESKHILGYKLIKQFFGSVENWKKFLREECTFKFLDFQENRGAEHPELMAKILELYLILFFEPSCNEEIGKTRDFVSKLKSS